MDGIDRAVAPDASQLSNDPHTQLTTELRALLAPDWQRLDAAFSFTVTDEAAHIVVSDGERAMRMRPSATMLELLRTLRHQSAQSGDGPWWRFLVFLTSAGHLEVDYDYGLEPFPADHLLPVQAYQADLQAYPRKRLPVWLAAYIGHNGRQTRTPREAVSAARSDHIGSRTALYAPGLPSFPLMWARWAAVSAAFVAANSPWGPRISTALGWFESSSRSGSTLHRLPNGRAVLSGGLWNAAALDAAYNDGAPMPQLYRGAPDWVADPVLNPRAANGLLSFCYWWDGAEWHRGESPEGDALSAALPGISTKGDAIAIITELIDESDRAAVADLVSAAEIGAVSRTLLARLWPGDSFDIDSAFYQLMLAGIAIPDPPQAI